MKKIILSAIVISACQVSAHELDQRIGGYQSEEGESRSMARLTGRGNLPAMLSGDVTSDLVLSGSIETLRSDAAAFDDNAYMKENFPGHVRYERNVGVDSEWTFAKRTDFAVGGGMSGDGVTKSKTKRGSVGQWFLGDQLRLGFAGSATETTRPAAQILDTDYTRLDIRPDVRSTSTGVSAKAILNPTTIVNADYTQVRSTDRPALHAWNAGVREHIVSCDCAVHGDVGRVINIGAINTNMTDGELTGTQWGLAYLQTLWAEGHFRLGYRFAREDEYTRAYGDHLVFGSDSYTAAISHEISGETTKTLIDVAATRYIRNKNGTGTALEMGAAVKF